MQFWSRTSRLGRMWQPYERISNLDIALPSMAELRIQSPQKPLRLLLDRVLLLKVPILIAVLTILIILGVSLFLALYGNPFHNSHLQDLDIQNHARREAIKSAFKFAWDGYYAYAFPHDELKPASNSPGTSRNDWGATAVDTLGTAILMEMPDVVNIILAHVKLIDFHATNTSISVFESTIRYMGGLLSAYELLTGPFAPSNQSSRGFDFLVDQAKNLGDVLCAAFVDGDSLPSGKLDPQTHKGNGKNGLAGAGTLVSSIERQRAETR
jgi:mannosyl-oligosaccharide alpha-1,2-mannosidase